VTVMSRPDEAALDAWLEDYSLSELASGDIVRERRPAAIAPVDDLAHSGG